MQCDRSPLDGWVVILARDRIAGREAVFSLVLKGGRSMSRKARWKAAVAAAVSVATWGSTAAGSEAAWSPPVTVVQGSFASLHDPQLAGSARNGATVAWRVAPYDTLIARRIRRNGTLGPRRRLSETVGSITVGPSGTTVAVWSDERRRILARRMTPHGKLGRVHRLGRWSASRSNVEIDVGLDARGNATIVWSTLPFESSQGTTFDGIGLHARRLSVTGKLGRRIEVPLDGGGNIHPRVVVTPAGRATVAWDFLGTSSAIRAATINRRGRLGPVLDISTGAGAVHLVDLAGDPNGSFTATWWSLDSQYLPSIGARRVGADGSLGPPHVLAASSARNEEKIRPSVVLDRAGNATVAWVSSTYMSASHSFLTAVESRRIDVNGNLTPVTNVTAPVSDAQSFQSTVDPAGNQTVAWIRRIPQLESTSYVLQARRIGRDGGLGPIDTLASGGCPNCDFVPAPKLVSDADGVVTAVWLEHQPGLRAAIKMSRLVPGR